MVAGKEGLAVVGQGQLSSWKNEAITSLHWGADGKFLAAGGENGSFQVWWIKEEEQEV